MNHAEAIETLKQLMEMCKASDIDFVSVLDACGYRREQKNRGKPIPYVFDSDSEFEQLIRNDAQSLLDKYLGVPFDTIRAAVVHSVAGNTFRAFPLRARGADQKPSEIYRDLVAQIFERNWQYFAQMTSEQAYDDFVIECAKKVEAKFDQVADLRGFMGFGRASKLFNLSCKAMLRYKEIGVEQRSALVQLAHVPWDSFTIQGIRLLNPPFKVPTGQGMGWKVLNDEKNYLKLLHWIRCKCYALGFAPIHYEVVSWDRAHQQM